MNKINSIIIIIVAIIMGLLFYMNYQVNSVDDIFDQESFMQKAIIPNTVQQTIPEQPKKTYVVAEESFDEYEVDDGLTIPHGNNDAVIGD